MELTATVEGAEYEVTKNSIADVLAVADLFLTIRNKEYPLFLCENDAGFQRKINLAISVAGIVITVAGQIAPIKAGIKEGVLNYRTTPGLVPGKLQLKKFSAFFASFPSFGSGYWSKLPGKSGMTKFIRAFGAGGILVVSAKVKAKFIDEQMPGWTSDPLTLPNESQGKSQALAQMLALRRSNTVTLVDFGCKEVKRNTGCYTSCDDRNLSGASDLLNTQVFNSQLLKPEVRGRVCVDRTGWQLRRITDGKAGDWFLVEQGVWEQIKSIIDTKVKNKGACAGSMSNDIDIYQGLPGFVNLEMFPEMYTPMDGQRVRGY